MAGRKGRAIKSRWRSKPYSITRERLSPKRPSTSRKRVTCRLSGCAWIVWCRPGKTELPAITCAGDAAKASAALVAAVAIGQITPSEAVELGRLLESYVKTLEATDLEERLKKLEKVISQ
jgi:hypothetical protein